jgi:hypothetical protein
MRRAWCIAVLMVVALAASVPAPGALGVSGPAWHREPGGSPIGVTVAASGQVYVTGQIWAPPVGPDSSHRWAMVVAKYGPEGGLFWRQTWRHLEPGWSAHGRTVAPAPGGGVYVGGASTWYEDSHPIVWRYSSSGRLVWMRSLPYSIQAGEVESLAADANGVIAAVQSTGCCDEVRHNGVIVALDRDGRTSWRTDFEVPGIAATWDGIAGVAIGLDDRVYAVGHVDRTYFDSADDPAPDEDLVVQQLSRSGDVRWTRVIGDGAQRDRESATAVAARSGRVIVTAALNDWTRAWVGAFATDGARLWAHGLGQVYRTAPVAVAIAPWGPAYVAVDRTVFSGGDVSTTSTLRRYAPDGTLAWTRDLGDDAVRGVAAVEAVYLTIGRAVERWPR